jgi:hypothetical protein
MTTQIFVPGSNRRKVLPKPERFGIKAIIELNPMTHVILVEQPPQVRITHWCFAGQHEDRALSIPRMLHATIFFKKDFARHHAFFMKNPYSGPLTRLYQTIFPNGNDSGWVCIGNDGTVDEITVMTSLCDSWEAKMDIVLDYFWNQTAFNDHVISRFLDSGPRIHPNLRSLATWERTSRVDPNFVLTCNWDPAGTVAVFLHRLRTEVQ